MNSEELIKKQTIWLKAIFGCLAAIVAAIIIISIVLVPKVNKAVDDVEDSMVKINALIDEADEALENINGIDFENLNKSINDLETITSAIANIFGGGNK